MNLMDYSSSQPIFIDANIFLDYALPNIKFGEKIADFLERIEMQELTAVTTPVVLNEVSYILLLQRGMTILKSKNRDEVRSKIKADGRFASICYDAVDTFNELLSNLDGLKLTPVQPEDYLLASDLGRAYNLLPIDALHLSAMRREHISDIASRDRDFKGIDGIRLWSP